MFTVVPAVTVGHFCEPQVATVVSRGHSTAGSASSSVPASMGPGPGADLTHPLQTHIPPVPGPCLDSLIFHSPHVTLLQPAPFLPHQGLDLKNVSFILIPHLVSWGLIALENLASYFIEKLSFLFLKACLSLHFLHPLPPPYSTGTPSHYWFFLFHFFQAISITRSLCSDELHQSQISSPPNFVLGFPLSLFLSALQFGFCHHYPLKLLF